MNNYVMQKNGFVALDSPAQCGIAGGTSGHGLLGDILGGLFYGLSQFGGAAGRIGSFLACNVDSFIDGFKAGWNK